MKQKIIYISLSLLIILNVLVFIISLFEKNNTYMILDTKTVWKINKGKVTKVSTNKIKKLNYANAKFYSDTSEEGYFGSDNNFKFYTDLLEQKETLSNGFIVVGNQKVSNYKRRDTLYEKDINIIGKFLKKQDINYDPDATLTRVFDVPNDTSVYSVESLSDGGPSEDGYSIVFYVSDDISEVIYLKQSESKRVSALNKVIDLDNDMIPEIVLLSDVPGSAGNECYSLYKYNNAKYEPIIKCEEE